MAPVLALKKEKEPAIIDSKKESGGGNYFFVVPGASTVPGPLLMATYNWVALLLKKSESIAVKEFKAHLNSKDFKAGLEEIISIGKRFGSDDSKVVKGVTADEVKRLFNFLCNFNNALNYDKFADPLLDFVGDGKNSAVVAVIKAIVDDPDFKRATGKIKGLPGYIKTDWNGKLNGLSLKNKL